MPRGGYHENAERWGRLSNWNTPGGTKTIRVPIAIADEVLDYAHKIDEERLLGSGTTETESNEGFMGLKVYQFRGSREWVKLSDLVRLFSGLMGRPT